MGKRRKSDSFRWQADVKELVTEAGDVLGLTTGAATNHLLRLGACVVLRQRPGRLRQLHDLFRRTDEYRLRRKADQAADAARASVLAEAADPAKRKLMFGPNETWRDMLKKLEKPAPDSAA